MVAQQTNERTGVLEARYGKPYRIIIGIDEVGRGALAGPITVGAVALYDSVLLKLVYENNIGSWMDPLTDSKKLTPSMRSELSRKIKKYAEGYTVISLPASVIDEIGIGRAFEEAADTAAAELMSYLQDRFDYKEVFILTDGMVPVIHGEANGTAVPKADALSWSVAAASVVAKVSRDKKMSSVMPDDYNFAKHKGYGTPEHYRQIKTHGLHPLHRRSFNIKR